MQLEYDNIYSFQDNYALVEKEGKYGIIDTMIREIVPTTLDDYMGYDLSPYFFDSWLYGLRNDSLIVYDTSGSILHYYKLDTKLTPNVLADQSFFIDSLKVRTSDNLYLYSGSKNWGCTSPKGDTIVPFKYQSIKPGLDQTIIATRGGNKNLETFVYNLCGDTLWKTYNIPVFPWKVNDYYFYKSIDKEIQIWDANFLKIDTIYFENIVVSENYVWLKSKTKWTRHDSNLDSKEVAFDHILQNKYWGAVWKGKKVALINSKGEFITPFIYEGKVSDYISNSSFIIARNSEQVHILNSTGEIIRYIDLNE